MASILTVASSRPTRVLEPNETLLVQGEPGGALYVLEDGELLVERDGVPVTTISHRNALVGEMSVLLDKPHSATVRAVGIATVRTIEDAKSHLLADPEMALGLASLVAGRLDATTAVLVQLSREHPGKTEQGFLARILSAIHLPLADDDDVTDIARNDLFGPAS